jgi:hypothetical protein
MAWASTWLSVEESNIEIRISAFVLTDLLPKYSIVDLISDFMLSDG